MLDDITDFVSDNLAHDVADLASDMTDGRSRRRKRGGAGSMLFYIVLVIAMVAVFWAVFTA